MYETCALRIKLWSVQVRLAPWEPTAMLQAACGQNAAFPAEGGSTAPALHVVGGQIPDINQWY